MKVIKSKRPLKEWSIEAVCHECETKLLVERKDVFYVSEKRNSEIRISFLYPSYKCQACGKVNDINPGDIPVNVIKTLEVRK